MQLTERGVGTWWSVEQESCRANNKKIWCGGVEADPLKALHERVSISNCIQKVRQARKGVYKGSKMEKLMKLKMGPPPLLWWRGWGLPGRWLWAAAVVEKRSFAGRLIRKVKSDGGYWEQTCRTAPRLHSAAWQLVVLRHTKTLGSVLRSKRGLVSGDGEALHRAGLSRGKKAARYCWD